MGRLLDSSRQCADDDDDGNDDDDEKGRDLLGEVTGERTSEGVEDE